MKRSETLLALLLLAGFALAVPLVAPTTHAETLLTTVRVGTYPNGIAYDSGKGEVFVGNENGNNTVSVISDATNAVVATVKVGTNPHGVAYDSGKGEVFVANGNNASVSVISDSTNSVVATIAVGVNPFGVA
jgi:serine/threonine-protein kinase